MEDQCQSLKKSANHLLQVFREDNQFAGQQKQGFRISSSQQIPENLEENNSPKYLKRGKEKEQSMNVQISPQEAKKSQQVVNNMNDIATNSGSGNPTTNDIRYRNDRNEQKKKIGQLVSQKMSSRKPIENLNVSLLKKNQKQSQQNYLNPEDLESKIKEIAFQIRKKVKKDGSKSKKTAMSSTKATKRINQREVVLIPIKSRAQNISFHITSPSGISRVTPINIAQAEPELQQADVIPTTIIKHILKRDILSKVFKEIEDKEQKSRMKLKLDPLKHHYPMTIFRKAVLEEQKSQHLKEEGKQKEKQLKLFRRKQIFNNSRYQRYTQILSKHQNMKDIPLNIIQSDVFSVGLEQNSPEQQDQLKMETITQNSKEKRIEQERTENKKPKDSVRENNKKQDVSPEINELNNLIKNMMESNENYENSKKIMEDEKSL